MKSISIVKTLNLINDSIELKYDGIPNDNINLDKIDKLLEDFINNHKHNYMKENVSIVRTILRDCEEKLLVISYQDGNGLERVEYDNTRLSLYEKIKKEENSENFNRYKIKYEPQYGIKLDYNNHENNVSDYRGIELFSKEITDMMKQIYHLKNVKAIVLDTDDKALIEIYKLFYNEAPDFISKDINIKVQTMMSILAEFGISLNCNYAFSLYGKEIPLSSDLLQRVNKLYPLGKVDKLQDSIKLDEEAKKIIEIVGKNIRESISSKQNKNEALASISRVIYTGGYHLSSKSNIKKYLLNADDEIESSIKLVKRIKSRINKAVTE